MSSNCQNFKYNDCSLLQALSKGHNARNYAFCLAMLINLVLHFSCYVGSRMLNIDKGHHITNYISLCMAMAHCVQCALVLLGVFFVSFYLLR